LAAEVQLEDVCEDDFVLAEDQLQVMLVQRIQQEQALTPEGILAAQSVSRQASAAAAVGRWSVTQAPADLPLTPMRGAWQPRVGATRTAAVRTGRGPCADDWGRSRG
jgi:hypothetical protein